MNEAWHLLNEKVVREKDLCISPRDLGFTRGYAVFDFLITYPTRRPFMLSRHIDRLYHSAELVGLKIPLTKEEMTARVRYILDINTSEQKTVRIMVSGGVSSSLVLFAEPTIIVQIDSFQPMSAMCYEQGVAVVLAEHERYLPEAKTHNYIEGVRQAQCWGACNAVETLYYNDAQVFEGSVSNVFAKSDGRLLTPKSNILHGITRGVLLEILPPDMQVEVVDFSLNELLHAEEVFLTGSNKEVLPVVRLGNVMVGNGAVGETTKKVMKQFREFTQSNVW